jgi:FtsX-like permease family
MNVQRIAGVALAASVLCSGCLADWLPLRSSVVKVAGSTKRICQVTGEFDHSVTPPTLTKNRTERLAKLRGSDLGQSFTGPFGASSSCSATRSRSRKRPSVPAVATPSRSPFPVKTRRTAYSCSSIAPPTVATVRRRSTVATSGFSKRRRGVLLSGDAYVVVSRTREIATLRAIGFGRAALVCSVLAEAAALASLGGAIGSLTAWLLFDGYAVSTLNFQSISQVAFAFAVTPALVAEGLTYAVGLGVIGAMWPACRAARLPIVTGLREM